MSKNHKSYRIRTEVGAEAQYINFNIDQTYDTFEILSLKFDQINSYKLMTSDTGVIVGRVLANGGFGIPNAKLSIFIPYDGNEDDAIKRVLYHYGSARDTNTDGVRYNLLPDDEMDDCHQNIGTFPTKRYLLDNDDVLEVFDKYYKYTTRTNNSGDYMLYGIPVGTQNLHCDIDLSDIGVLSQTPRDMSYKGYNIKLFDSPTKFKKDTNLASLAQVITQDKSVYVYPFWGDTTDTTTNAAITRCDIQVDYKFEPTCIFIGSVITDTGKSSLSKKCIAAKGSGEMRDMVTGSGTIEMIRKTSTGDIEQFSVEGNEVIDEDGTWCYQIPMNLDYVMTDEYGNTVLSNNPDKGIATRARVRFRISLHENPADGVARKRAKYLVPNNPRLVTEDYPKFCKAKKIDYEFGSETRDEDFRDLMWNNVYTVKNYIPRVQKNMSANNLKHLGIKKVNHSDGNNPMPYNKLVIKFNFLYTFICVLIKILIQLTRLINSVLSWLGYFFLQVSYFCCQVSNKDSGWGLTNSLLEPVRRVFFNIHGNNSVDKFVKSDWSGPHCCNKNGRGFFAGTVRRFLRWVMIDTPDDDKRGNFWKYIGWAGNYTDGFNGYSGLGWWFLKVGVALSRGITLSGLCEDEDGFPIEITPGISDKVMNIFNKGVFEFIGCPPNASGCYSTCCKGYVTINNDIATLYNCIENQLAQDNEVTKFNFYDDWVNGVLYMPLWYRRIKPKRRFLFIKLKAKDEWCSSRDGLGKKKNFKLRVFNNCVIKRTVNGTNGDNLKPLTDDYKFGDISKSIADDETGLEVTKFKKKNEENCFGYKCHTEGRSEVKINDGLIVEKETMLGDRVYYYKPTYFDNKNGNSDLVTLFATDIVLLGSLNSCDLHGIPQFFKILSPTSYQMPPDLLNETFEYKKSKENSGDYEKNIIDESTRKTEYTGADWGNLGTDQSNYVQRILGKTFEANENFYDNGGLFYGITCFNSYTKPKSIINLERICEIGVSLDESQDILKSRSSLNNGNINDDDEIYESLTPDGYISYDEIYNHDYRSMFATLNGNFLKTKLNYETGLTEYDLTHVYLSNFDGSLKNIMKGGATQGNLVVDGVELNGKKANYANNYRLEEQDKEYILFRYGDYYKGNDKRKKIYYYENNGTMSRGSLSDDNKINPTGKFPRYENSFYFYFGLKEGKTAIDKFYSKYYAECTKDNNLGISFEVEFKGNQWCSKKGGYIRITHELDVPLSIELVDKDTQTKSYKAKDIAYNDFYVGTKNDELKNESEYVKLEHNGTEIEDLPNDVYIINIIDANGRTYQKELDFKDEYLTYDAEAFDFSLSNKDLDVKYGDSTNSTKIWYGVDKEGNKQKLTVSTNAKEILEKISKNIIGYYIEGNPSFQKDGFSNYDSVNNTVNFTDGTATPITLHTTTISLTSLYYFTDSNNKLVYVQKSKEDGNFDKFETNSDYVLYSVIKKDDTFYDKIANVGKPSAENEFNIDEREIGGYIVISNISVENFKIEIKSDIDGYTFSSYYKIYNGVANHGENGYLGKKVELNDSNEIVNTFYYFGVPYGNIDYEVSVIELCDQNEESENRVRKTLTVYEGALKMFINGVDYDLIRDFRTGWDNIPINITNYQFTANNIKGWDQIDNIGVNVEKIKEDIEGIKKLLNENKDEGEVTGNEDDAKEYPKHAQKLYTISSTLFSPPIGNDYKKSGCVYTWNDEYVVGRKEFGRYDKTKDGIESKIEMIEDVIDKRLEFTYLIQGSFRCVQGQECPISLSYQTKSTPVKYLIAEKITGGIKQTN